MNGLAPDVAREIALEAARLAGARVLEGWGRVGAVRTKSLATDLLTEWDLASERVIAEVLARRAPQVPILAEEGGASGGADLTAGRFIVDPIDGTVNFVHGLPLFTVSVGYEHDGRVVAGVVLAPALGWEFSAARGAGATMNGVPLAVSGADSLAQSMLATGFPYDRAISPKNNFREFDHLQRVAGAVRRLGSASLDLCLVARGWYDGYWEYKLSPWDVAAGAVIVEEAGGRVTSIDGGPFAAASGEAVATNGRIHDELVAALAATPR